MQIKKYNGETAEPQHGETIFYIQSHGNNAGRPLRKPIPNCWEVRTTRSADYEILYIVFESRILKNFIVGSVIPFIRLNDYKNIIFPILENSVHDNHIINTHYLQIRKIEAQEQQQEKIKKLLRELKRSISIETFKKIKVTY